MNWTGERAELLKKLWGDGLSASQIAAELGGITRNSVIGKAHRMGLETRAKQGPRMPDNRPRKPKPSRISNVLFSGYRPGRQLPAPRKKSAVLAPSTAPAESFRCTIMDLEDHPATPKRCRWPVGDPRGEEFLFCGAKPIQGLPYCDYHARMAYDPKAYERLGIRPLAAQ